MATTEVLCCCALGRLIATVLEDQLMRHVAQQARGFIVASASELRSVTEGLPQPASPSPSQWLSQGSWQLQPPAVGNLNQGVTAGRLALCKLQTQAAVVDCNSVISEDECGLQLSYLRTSEMS
jgi:hypothetical protein